MRVLVFYKFIFSNLLTKILNNIPPALGGLRDDDIPVAVVVEHAGPQVPDDAGPRNQDPVNRYRVFLNLDLLCQYNVWVFDSYVHII